MSAELADQRVPQGASAAREMIRCEGLCMRFPSPDGHGEFVALDGIDLTIARNEFVTLLGPSGCGKSTLLSLIAGFITQTAGQLLVDGERIVGPSPERGVVFQEFALFPWLRVRDNIRYGLRERDVPKQRQAEVVDEMLQLTGLEHVVDHYPEQLSGGLKQRVALARVLANDPKLLLLDEPFGALDEQRRMFLQDELLGIWGRRKKTAVFVTHSIEEAIVLGDRVVVMSAGPGTIRDVVGVDLPRPRDRTSDEFNAIRRQVKEVLFGDEPERGKQRGSADEGR
jgi:ABC-type nitrate/sulfonate/bicarbonate transport system ATPase subunit